MMLSTAQFDTPAKEREALFIALYKTVFPSVARYISRMGGSFEQAKDVFQDALIIYYEKVKADSLRLTTGEKAYIYGIARNLWIKRYNQQRRDMHFDDGLNVAEDLLQQPSSPKILTYLERAGKKCMELLRAFYYDKTNLETIALTFGFSGTRSATVQKFKCLEKVRGKIKEKSLTYEDFFE